LFDAKYIVGSATDKNAKRLDRIIVCSQKRNGCPFETDFTCNKRFCCKSKIRTEKPIYIF
jgi:hypothetical protein